MKTKNLLLLIISMCVSILLLCSCLQTNQDALQGTSWLLTKMNGTIPLNGANLTIEFAEEQISGSTGCNHFGGDYKVNGKKIEFIAIYNTEMGCMEPEGIMDQELVFLEILRSAAQFTQTEKELVLIDKTYRRLIFEPNKTNPPEVPSNDQNDTVQIEAPTKVPDEEAPIIPGPPWEYHLYLDPETGIAVFIPETWIVTGIVEGAHAILQSYQEDKYVGGEPLKEGDTKCDLNIQPEGISSNDLIEQWKSSSMTTILSEEPFPLNSGQPGTRFEIESMGQSISVVTELNGRVVVLTCFGDFSLVDEIAATLNHFD